MTDAKRLRMTRRALLQAGACSLAVSRTLAAPTPSRIAIIDWAMLETALAIGIEPIGATELVQYRANVIEPALPVGTTDIGLRGALNYELMSVMRPDLIVSSNFYEQQRGLLARIAPVTSYSVYEAGASPFTRAREATLALAQLVERTDAASRYIKDTDSELETYRAKIASVGIARVLVINLGDPRHFRAFGADSMFGDVLQQLGIANAWTDTTRYTAAAPVGLHKLAEIDDAIIVTVGPTPLETLHSLPSNAIWNALPAVQRNKVVRLGPINHFGALPAARRFAGLLARALPECCA